jgi:hypothetical protein
MAVTERVAAGAAFLDEHDPDWWRADVERAIDLETLDLTEAHACVLGQRCPLEVLAKALNVPVDELDAIDMGEGYDAYTKHLSGLSGSDRVSWARDHGFTLLGSDPDYRGSDWAVLTAEWKRVITERRSAS